MSGIGQFTATQPSYGWNSLEAAIDADARAQERREGGRLLDPLNPAACGGDGGSTSQAQLAVGLKALAAGQYHTCASPRSPWWVWSALRPWPLGGHTCALFADGVVKSWGANGYGQLGDGTTERKNTPTFVQFE